MHGHQKRQQPLPVIIRRHFRHFPIQQPSHPHRIIHQLPDFLLVPRNFLPMIGHNRPAQHSRGARGQHQRAQQEKHAGVYTAIPSPFIIWFSGIHVQYEEVVLLVTLQLDDSYWDWWLV